MGLNQQGWRGTKYFDSEGRDNLKHVLKAVKQVLTRREELRNLKLIFFTAYGEGPMLATKILRVLNPKIIAVTFPPTFKVKRGEEWISPTLTKEVDAFLQEKDVKIITTRLPFDPMEGAESHTREMDTIKSALAIFGESFPLCVQAVLQACDSGLVKEGEFVIGITGDSAAVIRTCCTQNFLSRGSQFFVREFICKPAIRELNRNPHGKSEAVAPKTLEGHIRPMQNSLEQ